MIFLAELAGIIVMGLVAAIVSHEIAWRIHDRERSRHAARRGGRIL